MPASTVPSLTALVLLAASLPLAAADFQDDFSDPASGWPNQAATRSTDLGFAVYTSTGGYQMTPVHDAAYGLVQAPRQVGPDVHVEADLFVYAGLGAGAGGIACRARDASNFYGFLAVGDQRLIIVRVDNGAPTVLAEGRAPGAMAGSVDTRLQVDCRGDALSVSARGGDRLSVRDGTFADGAVGLVVAGEQAAGTSAAFDDFVLRAAR